MDKENSPTTNPVSCPALPAALQNQPCLYRPEDDEIDLLDLLRVLIRHVRCVAAIIIVGLAGSIFYLFFSDDIYQAKATIMPVQGSKTINIPFFQQLKELDEIKNMLSANLPAVFQDTNTTTIRAVLQSRTFNIYLVEKYNLLPVLFDGYWDKKENKWIGGAQRQLNRQLTMREKIFGVATDFSKYTPTSIDGAELLMKKLKVEKSKPLNDWLELRFDDKDPAFAAAMLNKYIAELDYYLRNREIERAMANQKYLQELIKTQSNNDIKQGLTRVIIGQIEAAMYARVATDFAFKTVDSPLIPQQAFKPKRMQVLLLTFVVSLFCGIFVAFFIEYIGNARERWKQSERKEIGKLQH